MAHDSVSSQELLIKQDNNFVVGVTDNSTAKSKRHILSSGRVDVDDTITNIIIIRSLVRVWLAPEGEALLIHKIRRKVLKVSTLELDSLELFLNSVFVNI